MRLTTNKLLGIGLGAAVIAALALAFRPKPVAVDLACVTRGPMMVTVDEDGKTRVKERYVVSSPLAGQLLRIELKAGAPVEARRTLLAVIEPTDPTLLDARSRAEAEARVNAARSKDEFAQAEQERIRKLAAENVVSRKELDDVQTAAQVARFELEQAQAALLRTRADGASGRFEIHAPVNGSVLRVFRESATVVGPGTPLLELGDPADLEVEVDVLSTEAVKIKPGAKVFFDHWGGPNPLHGRVRLVEPAAFLKISALGVEEQRVWVIIDLTDPPEARRTLGDAYRVEARIVVWEDEDVLRVAAGALFRQGADWAVFRAANGRARLQVVRICQNNGTEAAVLDGLSEADRVILHPSDAIRDGNRVRERQR
jgi:HlyD family secretion protein